jgi:hypothetical protein
MIGYFAIRAMKISLNVKKSIAKRRVVLNAYTAESIFSIITNQVVRIFLTLGLLVVPVFMWIDPNVGPVFPLSIIPFLFFIPGLFGLYGLLRGDAFIRLRGIGNAKNHEIVLNFFEERYPDKRFYKRENQFSFYDKSRNLLVFYGKSNRILIIFMEQDILVNVLRFVGYGAQIPSPFHTFFHHVKINSLGKRLYAGS